MSATFPVIINVKFGGCILPSAVIQAYNAIPGVQKIARFSDFDRDDARLANLVENMQHESDLVVVQIPVEYKDNYEIDEYDGLETISINYASYQVAKIKEILADADDSKLSRINAIADSIAPNAYCHVQYC
jgi:hypothetical protein